MTAPSPCYIHLFIGSTCSSSTSKCFSFHGQHWATEVKSHVCHEIVWLSVNIFWIQIFWMHQFFNLKILIFFLEIMANWAHLEKKNHAGNLELTITNPTDPTNQTRKKLQFQSYFGHQWERNFYDTCCAKARASIWPFWASINSDFWLHYLTKLAFNNFEEGEKAWNSW